MIDLHCHILYGVDDGPKDKAQSLDMLSAALDAGFTRLVATPHYIHATDFDSQAEQNRKILRELQETRDLPILYLGSEVFTDHLGVDHLVQKRAVGINDGRYVLIEVPRESMHFGSLLNYIFELELAGFGVILAHAERYDFIQEDPNHLVSLAKRDVLIQLNLCSLTGRYGKKIERTARILLEHHMVHLAATDSHCTKDYKECIAAMEKLEELVGTEQFHRLLLENPNRVLNNEVFYPEAPIKVKKNPLLRWFKE